MTGYSRLRHNCKTVDSGQRTKFPTTIGVGDATPSASGSGISFPATQSASSDANTLDDYEEGTWTATFGTSAATYNDQVPVRYTKIGSGWFMCKLVYKLVLWNRNWPSNAELRVYLLLCCLQQMRMMRRSVYLQEHYNFSSTVIGATFRSNNTNIAILEVPVGN
jgi:hypothetical protein